MLKSIGLNNIPIRIKYPGLECVLYKPHPAYYSEESEGAVKAEHCMSDNGVY